MTEQNFREYCLGLADYLRRMISKEDIETFLHRNQEIKTNKDKQTVAFAIGIDLFLMGCRYSNGWQAKESQPSAKVIHFPIKIHRKRKREEVKAMCKEEYIYVTAK